MLEAIRKVLLRELDTLDREISLYPDDASLWIELPGLPNPGGNLALHLAGNLRHFIGAQLGASGYVRDRDAEFSARGLSREEVRERIAAAKREVATALAQADLAAPFPILINGIQMANGLALVHLEAHLAFHVGQIDYHRRAATGDRSSAGALSLQPLA